MDGLDAAIEDAVEQARLARYAGLSEEQLRRRLARAEDAHRRLSNVFGVLLLCCYVLVCRKELISGLTRLGELTGGG